MSLSQKFIADLSTGYTGLSLSAKDRTGNTTTIWVVADVWNLYFVITNIPG